MAFALQIADSIGSPPPLPNALSDPQARAKLINAIDGSFFSTDPSETDDEAMHRRVREIDAGTKFLEDEVPQLEDRCNIGLRLFAGCLSAAKMLRISYVTGPGTEMPVTPDMRANAFSNMIDPQCADDPIYRAGVEAAPALQRLRQQDPQFAGVPLDSPVHRYE